MLFSWMGRRNAGDGWVQLFHGSWHLTWAVGLGSCWGCSGLFRFGVAQHPEQAFPVSFQDHSSSSGENGSVQWPTLFPVGFWPLGWPCGQAFSLLMSSGAAGLV